MEITYKTKKIQKICTDASFASSKYGREMAEKIHFRIAQILSFPTVEEMIQYHVGRCHALTNNRKGQYAIDLVQPYRLIFTVDKAGNLQIANIEEIVDYH